ncbi:hypothetical protein GCM10025859_00420 [Alicyclobacillus fastidiosus]|nr:hypothetical protein GCM10025859_00420 [Alicyclobacillus fastidiosus]
MVGPEMMSWFTGMENDAIYRECMIAGTFFGIWYWDRFLNRVHENENIRDRIE